MAAPRILGLINARAGSKGVPGKNIRNFCGKPLIAWSVETAKKVSSINKIIVSTDGADIAEAAREAGAETPFLRPAKLAEDDALQIDVIIHAVEWLEKTRNEFYEYICLLQPTCPVRRPQDVQGALDLLVSSKADSVITVSEIKGQHPMTLYKQGPAHKLTPFIEAPKAGVTRQGFPPLFWRTGSVYAFRRSNLKERTLYGADARGFEVSAEYSANIDEELDWDIAEFLMKRKLAAEA